MLINDSYTFPINEVRKQFPALRRVYNGNEAVYLDGPSGSKVTNASIEAVANYMIKGGANLHGQFATSKETEATIMEAKKAVADMFAGNSNEVAFGANTTSLEFLISKALVDNWGEGDEIVLSEIDHRANIDPWLDVAKKKGMTVRWLKVNKDTITIDLSNIGSVINEKTKLVAVGLASNAVGTINEVEFISARAKLVNAIVVVDAAHAAPHFSINRDKLGADILLCSAHKFFGPHVGIAIIKEKLFKNLNISKLESSAEYIPHKLEIGTQNHEGIAGIKPCIDFIASLGNGKNQIDRIKSGFERIEEYENRLAMKIRKRLSKMEKVILYQAPGWCRKTPTIAFRIEGMDPQEVCRIMAEKYSIFITDGDFHATILADKLGINKTGGWNRIGISPYNSEADVDRFINAIKSLV